MMEFGVRWGQDLALFSSLRGIMSRLTTTARSSDLITFAGFPAVHAKDGTCDVITQGTFGVTKGYESHLEQLLDLP